MRPAIAAVELEDMSGRGFVGLMSRLNIEYADADAAEQAGCTTYPSFDCLIVVFYWWCM